MSRASGSSPVLAVESLTLQRGGRQLFQNLSLCVRPSELWQIEGANGTGKTSLLRILAGLSRYGFEGSVSRHSSLLYLGHQSAVKGLLSPRENLRLHTSGVGIYSDEAIDAALDSVGLFGFEDTPSHQLSAGQHRRVNLARLYLCEESPYLCEQSLWLLDEPFTAIDVEGFRSLEQRIEGHVAAGGAAVIVSHQALDVACEVHRLALGTQVQT